MKSTGFLKASFTSPGARSVIRNRPSTPVRTGVDGRFRITDLAPGEVMLAFKKPVDFIQVTRRVTAPANDVDVNLPKGGRISGRVVDKGTQEPVKSFDAGVSRGGAALMVTPAMRAFATDDGTFVI